MITELCQEAQKITALWPLLSFKFTRRDFHLVTLRHRVQRLLFIVSLHSGLRTGHQQVLHPSCKTGLRVCSHYFRACQIRTVLTTSCFADSHRIAVGLHATGCVSKYLNLILIKYFLNILFCNRNYLSIIVYFLLITTDTQSNQILVVLKVSYSVFCSHVLKSETRGVLGDFGLGQVDRNTTYLFSVFYHLFICRVLQRDPGYALWGCHLWRFALLNLWKHKTNKQKNK